MGVNCIFATFRNPNKFLVNYPNDDAYRPGAGIETPESSECRRFFRRTTSTGDAHFMSKMMSFVSITAVLNNGRNIIVQRQHYICP